MLFVLFLYGTHKSKIRSIITVYIQTGYRHSLLVSLLSRAIAGDTLRLSGCTGIKIFGT
jgi:predicted transcriptional regulator with HTH domain